MGQEVAGAVWIGCLLGRLSCVGRLVRWCVVRSLRCVGASALGGGGRREGGGENLPPLTDHHPKRSQRKRSRDGFGLRCWVLAQTKSRYKLIVATTTLA